jgi:uncharacterized membrane protein YjjP (DUF1212 family)
MDDASLQRQLTQIRRLQYLLLALVVAGYLAASAVFVGPWMTGFGASVAGVAVFLFVVAYRRQRGRHSTAEQPQSRP